MAGLNLDRIFRGVGSQGRIRLALGVGCGVAALTVGMAVAVKPLLIAIISLLILGLIIASVRPNVMYLFFLFSAFTTLPSFVPEVLPLPVLGLYIYEPFLYLACSGLTLKLLRLGRRQLGKTGFGLVIFSSSTFLMLFVGVLSENAPAYIIADARPTFDLLCTSLSTVLYLRFYGLRGFRDLALISLSFSAVLSVGASIGLLKLSGRSEVASLRYAETGADRLLTASTFPALALLCSLVAAGIVFGRWSRSSGYLLAVCFLITLLSFSRNSLIALSLTFLVAILAKRSFTIKARGLVVSLAAILAPMLLLILLSASGNAWAAQQVGAFQSRVLGGLSGEAVAADSSAQFRVAENRQILPKILESPILGNGFGAEYKAPTGAPGSFEATRAPSYAHMYYLWLALKGGSLAVVAFLLLAVGALRGFWRDPSLTVAGAPLIGFLFVSFVAPLGAGFPTAALLGFLIGCCYYVRETVNSVRAESLAVGG